MAHKNGEYPFAGIINGQHPLEEQVPSICVDYGARRRDEGEVFFFNFDLAKEIGLIPKSHPNVLKASLKKALLKTFNLQIINEYDVIHESPIEPSKVCEHRYIATRYLQLQHPNSQGRTSGDGRGIWNGIFQTKNMIWDFASGGTGATCLSPATAFHKKFFQTGNQSVAYGSGLEDLLEGFCAAVMSAIFHRNKIKTERLLAIIEFGNGYSVNVRAAKNLLRPAHFFALVKQSNLMALKNLMGYYYERQCLNEGWPKYRSAKERYQYFLKRVTENFAKTAAQFESEYIFCWMDWDGDNILMDGSIIDYGSVRQFGLFHYEYRYEDNDRWSTNILEQKNKAKYIVQTFAQMVDYLITEDKRNIQSFRHADCLKDFDEIFENEKDRLLLQKMGYPDNWVELLLKSSRRRRKVRDFRKLYDYFERVQSKKGKYEVSDGLMQNAVFCMRDLLRELPMILEKGFADAKSFISLCKSEYASRADLKITAARRQKILDFQMKYVALIEVVGYAAKISKEQIYATLVERAALLNRYERVTGDAILYIARKLVRERKKMRHDEFYEVFHAFVHANVLLPDEQKRILKKVREQHADMLDELQEIISECREGI